MTLALYNHSQIRLVNLVMLIRMMKKMIMLMLMKLQWVCFYYTFVMVTSGLYDIGIV